MKNAFGINSKIWKFIIVPLLSFLFMLLGFAARNVYAYTLTLEKNHSLADVEMMGGSGDIYSIQAEDPCTFLFYGETVELPFSHWEVISGEIDDEYDGWDPTYYDPFVKLLSDATIKAIYTGNHTITVGDSSHGSLTADVTEALPAELVTFTPTPDPNYRLVDVVCTQAWDHLGTISGNVLLEMPNFDVTVTGVFEEIPLITFDANGGSVSPGSARTGTNGKLASLPTPERGGFFFDGWYTDATGGDPVTTNTVFTTHTTIHAHWSTIHTVTYKVVNGKWDDGSTANKTEPVANGRHLAHIPNVGNTPNGGYREGSWSLPAPNTSATITGNVTYTYTYAPITVSFDANGGSVSPESAAVGSNGKLTSLPTPHRDNFNFAGWFNEAAGETTAVTLDKVYTADTTLVAHWTERPAEYTVTASDDGHGSAVASPTSGTTNTRVTITATPDRDYQFKEWRVIRGGVDLADRRRSRTTFNIGNANVEVKAIFEKKSGKKDDDDDDEDHHEESPKPMQPVNPNAIIGMSFAGSPTGNYKLGPQVQGPAAQAVFKANTPAGWKETFTFNMTVNDKANYTRKKGTLSFKIPSQYLKAGRTFAILGIDNNGKVKVFLDTDTKADTITINIDLEGYAFDLIYYD